jgi:NitT/TauT family transport system permease protein
MSPRGTDTPKSQGARALSLLGPIVAVSLAVLAWAAIRWVFELKDFVLPSPLGVANAFLDDPAPFLRGALQSAGSAMLGFAIAAIGGIVLGSLISLSRVVERSVYPLTLLFQMVPLVAIAPLLVLWFGYGRPAIVASAAIVSIFPVIASTVAGLGARDPNLDELFRVLGAGRLATWWKLALPSAVPSIMTGLKIAAGLATIGTVCGEFLAGEGGENAPLGLLITTALRNFQTDRVFVSVLLSAAVGFAVFGSVSLAGKLLLGRWMR